MGIPLVRGSVLYPIVKAMDEINVSSTKLLDQARLPQIDCCNPGDWISSERTLHVEMLMRRHGGIPSAAYYVAEAATIADMGEFGKHVLQSSTLKEALDRYCDNLIF